MKRKKLIRIITFLMALLMLMGTLLSVLAMSVYAAEDVEWRMVSGAPLITFRDGTGNVIPELENIPADSPELSFDSTGVTYQDLKYQRYSSMDLLFSYADYNYVVSDEKELPETDRMIAELEFENKVFQATEIVCKATAKNYLQVDLLFEDIRFLDDVHNEVTLFIQYFRKNSNGDELAEPFKGRASYVFSQAVIEEAADEEDKMNIELVLPEQETELPAQSVPYILIDDCTLENGLTSVMAGSSFDLNLTCRNSHDDLDLENILLQVDVPDGLKLNHPSNTFYIGNIGDQERFQQVLNFSTMLSANVKNYPVEFTFIYEYLDGEKRKEETTKAVIQIPVYQQTRFLADSIDTLMSYEIDKNHTLCSSFANLTRGNIYNVTATMVTDLECPQKVQHLGNLSAGEGGAVEFTLYSSKEGTAAGEIHYTYEDELGQVMEETVSFSMNFVLPEEEEKTEVVKEYITDLSTPVVTYQVMAWYWVVPLIAVMIAMTYLAIKGPKK